MSSPKFSTTLKILEEHQKQAEKIIKYLSRRYKIGYLEPEDIQQELRIHLLKKYNLFNPKKSSFKTFAYYIFINKIRDLNRYYKAKKRKPCMIKSEHKISQMSSKSKKKT